MPETINLEVNKYTSLRKRLFSFTSTENHQTEILDFCKQYNCDALFTNDLEIITLFLINQNLAEEKDKLKNTFIYEGSSFKITKTGLIFGKKYNFEILFKELNMNIDEFVWFSILLGTRFFHSEWLLSFYNDVYGHFNLNLLLNRAVC